MTVHIVPTLASGPRSILPSASANLSGRAFEVHDPDRRFLTTYTTR